MTSANVTSAAHGSTRFVVLDTETTGLNAREGDRVIELGCVEIIDRRLTGRTLHLYFNPDRESHPDALRIHGLTTEFLRDKPRFGDKATDILQWLHGAHLLIHNAAFDTGFLDAELERLGLPALATHVSAITDTLTLAKERYPGKRNSLDALCDRLGIDRSGRTLHGALLDAQLLADVYIHMTRGQHALLGEDGADGLHAQDVVSDVRASTVRDTVALAHLPLPVLMASPEESTAHEHYLADIDKTSGGKTVWRLFEQDVKTVA